MPFQMPRVASQGARGVGVPQVRGIGQGQEVNAQTMAAIQQFSEQIKQKRLMEQQQQLAQQEANTLEGQQTARSSLMDTLKIPRIPGSSVDQQTGRIAEQRRVNTADGVRSNQLMDRDSKDRYDKEKLEESRLYDAELYAIAQRDKEKNIDRRGKFKIDASKAGVGLGPIQKEYETNIGKKLGERQSVAQEAANSINVANNSLDLLEKGMKTGFASDFRTSFSKGLRAIGFSADENEIANTEAFVANQVRLLDPYVKAQGGRGFTDADREIYSKAVGADPSLNPQALKAIIKLNIKYSRETGDRYNKHVQGLVDSKSLVPKSEIFVKMPEKRKRGGLQGMLNPQAQQQPEGAPGSAVEFINKAIAGGMDRQEAINKAVEMRLN